MQCVRAEPPRLQQRFCLLSPSKTNFQDGKSIFKSMGYRDFYYLAMT